MNEHQEHLKYAIEKQQVLIGEINSLNTSINTKKEEFLKLQGVIEYLQSFNSEKTED